jgi:hypothetical protein
MANGPSNPRGEYTARIARWSERIARDERLHLLISNLRLAAAAGLALSLWLVFGPAVAGPAWILVPFAAFAALVVVHARVLYRNERARRARRLYQRGLERLDGRWAGAGADGSRFLDDHPYARDLDLFGPGSLFQLLNVGKTEAGEETLAGWLKRPAAADEVRARQAAVAEMAPEVSFREALAVVAAEAHVGRTSALNRWVSLAPLGLPRWVGMLFLVCGLVTIAVLAAALTSRIPASPALGWLVVVGLVFLRWRKETDEAIHRIDAASDDLALFRELLETVEAAGFSAPWLVRVHQQFTAEGAPPSKLVRRLQTLVSILNQYQHNPYFRVIGVPLLVGGQVAVAIDRWHSAHGRAFLDWLKAIGELEAMASLATYAYEHPGAPFPEVVDAGPIFEAEGLAHPLLPEAEAVPNDLRLGGTAPHVYLVSGSNMSGKSTLLRAVGVNVVVALAGAPVRAAELRLSPLAIGATLRVTDSLQEGYSRFYAEILRIRSIVELARGPMPVLFLLDEILHGTNSYDRRIGAEAIVRALVAGGAIGLVTTHDLALTELVVSLGPQAENVHFEDRLVDDRIAFDYRLRRGVVERSNALALMRAIGIDV